MSIFKPMLATDADLNNLRFPLLASTKLDGIRAVVRDGIVYSRSNKPIPNKYVQQLFSEYEFFDGELIVGEPTSKTVYRDTVSGVMSEDGEPAVSFYVFDHVEFPTHAYTVRTQYIEFDRYDIIVRHGQVLTHNLDELLIHEQTALAAGYEGLILRDPAAPYKMGRSTAREGYLLKLKRFVDAEAVVIGFEERMHNGNAATISELGRTKRSSHKANKSGRGDLGALVCRTAEGIEFNIGTGFTDSDRQRIWDSPDHFLGKYVKFKYFPVGVKEAPRHPVFLGWRDVRDMS